MPIQPVSGEIKAQPLNDNFSYLDSKTSNIAKGSPSGTYATKEALKAKYPNGNTNIYVVQSDGNWYFWDGSDWIAGGKYQERGIADKSVEQVKVTDEFDDYIRLGWYSKNGRFSNFYTSSGGTVDVTNSYLFNLSPFLFDGKIKQVRLALNIDAEIDLYVMTGDGNNYRVLDSCSLECSKGDKLYNVSLTVSKGAFLAFHGPIVFKSNATENTGFQTFTGITKFEEDQTYTTNKYAGGYQFGISIIAVIQEQGKPLFELESRVSSLEETFEFESRPTDGIVRFKTQINADLTYQNIESTSSPQDGENLLEDDAILWLPDNYSKTGRALKLVIFCHGSGETIDVNRTSLPEPFGYLLANGYAMLDVNGIPKQLSGGDGVHFNNPLALQSYVKAYHFVINHYNIDRNGVYLSGMSLGGGMGLLLAQSKQLPVRATGVFCPTSDQFYQSWCRPWTANQRYKIAKYFNFNDYNTFQFSVSGTPTQSEIDYFKQNTDKIIGYNPIHMNTTNWKEILPYEANDIENAFNELVRGSMSPTKIWHCEDDNVVPPTFSRYFIQSLKNGGQIAQYRPFPTGGHYAWIGGNQIVGKDKEGNDYLINVAGYELLKWFERF